MWTDGARQKVGARHEQVGAQPVGSPGAQPVDARHEHECSTEGETLDSSQDEEKNQEEDSLPPVIAIENPESRIALLAKAKMEKEKNRCKKRTEVSPSVPLRRSARFN